MRKIRHVITTDMNSSKTGLRALVADDQEINRLAARSVLIGLGATVQLAADGAEAIDPCCEAMSIWC